MQIATLFAGEIKPRSAWFRYGFLAAVLALVALGLRDPQFDQSDREKHLAVFTPLLLLLNHLAFSFRWSRDLTIFLRASALLWLLFVCIYILTK
jgi:hypothetical protein